MCMQTCRCAPSWGPLGGPDADSDNAFGNSTGLLMRMQIYLQAVKHAQNHDKCCSDNSGFVKIYLHHL